MEPNVKNSALYAIDYALKRGCREAKTVLTTGSENEVEWRDGRVNRLTASSGCQLAVGLYVDGRYSVVSTNRLERSELEQFIDKGIENTRALEEDSCRRLPDPALYYRGARDDMDLCDNHYFDVAADDRIAVAKAVMEEITDERVISASGMEDDNITESYIVASNGFEGEIRRTRYAVSAQVCVRGTDGERPEDYWFTSDSDWNRMEKSGIGIHAQHNAVRKIGARRIPSGKYNVVIDRLVASQLVNPLISALRGEALHRHTSFLLDRKGEPVASKLLTVMDSPLQRGQMGACLFDRDGVALFEMPVIECGVLKNYYISQYMSRKMETAATRDDATILKFALGTSTTDGLIRSLGNGVLITGFNGGNCNGTTGDFSYGIEGYRVENGVITAPVSEMLMTGNMLDLWQNLCNLSSDPLPCFSWQVPSLLFADVVLN